MSSAFDSTAQPIRHAALAVGVVLLLGLGVWTYGFALRLPLFSDDIVQTRWLSWHSLPALWRSAEGMGYFRPLTFSLWKAVNLLGGGSNPVALHGLMLGLHLLNTLLVVVLVAEPSSASRPRLALGLAAATLFMLYPFSYQVVPWVSALMYTLGTALVLGAVVTVRRADARQRPAARVWLRVSMLLALLAPFAHETGVLVAPALLLFWLTDEQPMPFRTALRRSLPYWACSAIGLAAWLAAPKGTGQDTLLNLASRWQNLVYFAQGLIYPVAPLAKRGAAWGLAAMPATGLLAGVTLLAWGGLLTWAGRGRLVLRAVGWYALLVLPSWAFLNPEYVRGAGRFCYGASVGAALLWAIPIDLGFPRRSLTALLRGVVVLVVVGAAVMGYRFNRARAQIYREVGLAVEGLLAARPAAPQSILLVNYPQWLAPWQTTFPVGYEGVVLVPPYANGLGELLWTHTGVEQPTRGVVYMALQPQSPWRFTFPGSGTLVDSDVLQTELRQVQRVIITSYDQPDIAVLDAGGLEGANQAPASTHLAGYAGKIGLLSGEVGRQPRTLRVVLRWQCWAEVGQETSVFLHLYDASGKLTAQADGYPLLGAGRMVAWRVGDVWRDVRYLTLPGNLPRGEYTLKVGLYPTGGGARLRATGPDGVGFADEAVPVEALTLP